MRVASKKYLGLIGLAILTNRQAYRQKNIYKDYTNKKILYIQKIIGASNLQNLNQAENKFIHISKFESNH